MSIRHEPGACWLGAPPQRGGDSSPSRDDRLPDAGDVVSFGSTARGADMYLLVATQSETSASAASAESSPTRDPRFDGLVRCGGDLPECDCGVAHPAPRKYGDAHASRFREDRATQAETSCCAFTSAPAPRNLLRKMSGTPSFEKSTTRSSWSAATRSQLAATSELYQLDTAAPA
jgi:hypothetical protein